MHAEQVAGGRQDRRPASGAATLPARVLPSTRRPGRFRAWSLFLFTAVVWCAGVASTGPALGQTTTTAATVAPPGLLPVNPGPNGYFEFTLAPDGHRDFAVIVKNLSDAAASYPLYVAEASTATSSGVAYSQHTSAPGGTASWVQVPAGPVVLGPKQNKELTLRITVPGGTAPGDYVAAIAADSPQPSVSRAPTGSGTDVQLTTTSRVVVAVVVHVPGPLHPSLNIAQPGIRLENGGRQILDIPFIDDGNQLIKPHLKGTITACSGGAPVVSIDRQLDTFVPHTTVTYSYPLAPTTLPAGCYRIELAASYDGGTLGSFRGTLDVSPQAAGTVTTVNGGPGDSALRSPKAPGRGPSPVVLAGIGVTGALLAAALVLLLLLLRRRP
jgi:hypothetical protein